MAEISENSIRDQIVDDVVEDEITLTETQTIRQNYTGVSSDNIQLEVDNTDRTITANILQIQYPSKLSFPSVGSDKLIYVDLSDNSLWRYDADDGYVCVGTQYETINNDYDAETNRLATKNDLPVNYGTSLSVSGTSLSLLDEDGNVLNTVTTQDTGFTSITTQRYWYDWSYSLYNKYTSFVSTDDYVGFYVLQPNGMFPDEMVLVTNENKDTLTRPITAGSTKAYTAGNALTSLSPNGRMIDLVSSKTFVEVNDIDDTLSTTSKNPVQNKIIAQLIPAQASSSNQLATASDLPDISGKLDKKPDGTNDLISNNKVSTTYLPDYLLGQVLYGGTVNANTAVATLSTNAKTKLGTSSNTITLTNDTTAITGYGANEGIYYIVDTNGNFASLGLVVGDWLISDGTHWKKIDNTDAVTSVRGNAEQVGQTGNVVIDPDDLDDTNTTNKFVTASDITKLNGIEAGAEVNDVTDVQINSTSILTGTVANFVTNTAYDATTNKIATMSDLPTDTGATSVDLHTGDTGNVVTNMTYDATTRKITFEKGITAITDISGKQDKNVGSANAGKILKVDSNGDITVSTVVDANIMVDTDTFILDGGNSNI